MFTRVSSWPLRSRATSVFSKVAGAGLSAIFSTSSRCSLMPSSSAGLKSSSRILSNGGAWNGRELAVKKGLVRAAALVPAAGVFSPADADVAKMPTSAAAPTMLRVRVRSITGVLPS